MGSDVIVGAWRRLQEVCLRLFLPTHLRSDADLRRRASFGLAALAVLVPAAFLRGVQLIDRGPRTQGFTLLFAGSVALLLPAVVYLTGSFVVAAHLGVLALMAVLTSAVYLSGGIGSFALLTLPFVPLLATFLVGKRGGAVWTVLTLAEITFWAAVEHAGVSPANQFPAATRLHSAGTAAFLICVLVYAIAVLVAPKPRAVTEATAASPSAPVSSTVGGETASDSLLPRATADIGRRSEEPFFLMLGHLATAREAQGAGAHRDAASAIRDAELAARELRDVLDDLRLARDLHGSVATAASTDVERALEAARDRVAEATGRRWSVRIRHTGSARLHVDERLLQRLFVGSLRVFATGRPTESAPIDVDVLVRFDDATKVCVRFETSKRMPQVPELPGWLLEAVGAHAQFAAGDRSSLELSFDGAAVEADVTSATATGAARA
jgi:hypothetical protein